MRVLERKNPFPRKALVNLEGGTKDRRPTLPTPPLQWARELAEEYIDTGIGQVVTVRGAYGSGKTHLISYVLQQIDQKIAKEFKEAYQRPVQLYAKSGSSNFLDVYRKLAGQLDLELLQRVNARFLGQVISKEIEDEQQETQQLLKKFSRVPEDDVSVGTEGKSISEHILVELRKDPKIVHRYVEKLLVTPERALGGRSSEVREITSVDRDEFKKVIFYLDDNHRANDARDWLIARQDMPDEALRRLGVVGQIANADDALDALRLLVRLFRYAEIPLLVYIDQIEKLLLGIDLELAQANAARLQSTVEYFALDNAFLLLAGADEAWTQLRKDFASRVGPTTITMEQITRKISHNLVKVYLEEMKG